MEMNYNLNTGQQAAADAFFKFLLSDDKEFIISGHAGTGKTYLMSYIIDETLPRYNEICKLMAMKPVYNSVVMTATTNKAAEVLALATKRPTQTIHSFLGLKVVDDYDTGDSYIARTTAWTPKHNKIIFIDECSMVNTALYKEIQDSTVNCKIVYVGDHNQLAPVKELISPVYKHNSPMFALTEQMRNAGQPALMDVCKQLRETVESKQFKPIKIVPGIIDYVDPDEFEVLVNTHFKGQNPDARILAYTNRRVLEYNDYIRSIRNLPVEFQTGEILVNNSPLKIGQRVLAVEAEVEITKTSLPFFEEIDPSVNLEVIKADLMTSIGEKFTDIVIPIDKNHYTKLMKYYKKEKEWHKYYNLKNNYPDLRPRDAATVHKAQGSTYDTVFIDLGNISGCNFVDQTARMLYVAFSRAKNHVYVSGELASKYGGIIV